MLFRSHVLLDCANREVIFPDEGLAEFLNSYFSKPSLKKGAMSSLLTATVTKAQEDGVRRIMVVQEFEDVFVTTGILMRILSPL